VVLKLADVVRGEWGVRKSSEQAFYRVWGVTGWSGVECVRCAGEVLLG